MLSQNREKRMDTQLTDELLQSQKKFEILHEKLIRNFFPNDAINGTKFDRC